MQGSIETRSNLCTDLGRPVTDSVRFTQLWSKHSQFHGWFILSHKKRFN